MERDTVDVGIDLGTTTSAIAVMTESGPSVVRNNKRREFTPSAVYVNAKGAIFVGDAARDRLDRDEANVCTEFKLRLGVRDAGRTLPASGRTMDPVELSAEVLKSVRENVRRDLAQEVTAAVITVPAAFELDQNSATQRAAELASISSVTLMQEPTAAAWAYGDRSRGEKGFWLVYDFGGGTFDAAVIRIEDGEFIVINHEGDNFLGGKLLDWALVEQVLLPALRERYPQCAGADRTDPRWSGTMSRLKLAAERAKIDLSDADAIDAEIEVEVDGDRLELVAEVTRADVEAALDPLYTRSLNLCKKALADEGLSPNDLDRVLLVGGSTLVPALRERLADPHLGLGVPLDYSIDPITVVAQGAAIFASTIRHPRHTTAPTGPGEVAVRIEAPAMGSETDPFVAGLLQGSPSDWSGYTVELTDSGARPPWTTGSLPVTTEGQFETRVRARSETTSTYTFIVRTPNGNPVVAVPPTLTYRHTPGAVGNVPGATHSLGVALADNTVSWLIRKGQELPARSKRIPLYTTIELSRTTQVGAIRVPLVQGERDRADRNTNVGMLELRPTDVRMDVRVGSEVEVMVVMTESQDIEAGAYIPVLDKDFPIHVDKGRDDTGGKGLRRQAAEASDRYQDLRTRAASVDAPEARRLLDTLDEEGGVRDADTLAAAAQADVDAEQSAQQRLRDTQAMLDDVEDALDIPVAADELRAALKGTTELLDEIGDKSEHRELSALEASAEDAVARRDLALIKHQKGAIDDLAVRVLRRTGHLDTVVFGSMEAQLSSNDDPRVQDLLRRGRAAIQHNDSVEIRAVTRQLRPFLPHADEDGDDDGGFGSTLSGGRW